jgi:hypothetical protein
MITLQPVRFVADAESWIWPDTVVDAIETVTTPADGVTAPVGVIVASVGVTLAMLMAGELAFDTVLPFGSLSATVATAVPLGPPPFAMSAVGVAVQASCVGVPNTVIGALPVCPEADATTLQGWVAEFIAVAANRPVAVMAPHPPVTD